MAPLFYMKQLFTLIVIFSIVRNCSPTVVPIDIDKILASDTLSIDSFIDSVQIIPLEDTEESHLINGGRYVYSFGNDRIAILDCFSDFSIRVFDYEGHFLARIGRQGENAGEYSFAYDIEIDDDSNMLVVLDPVGKIIRYSLSNNYGFVDELSFLGAITAGHYIKAIGDNQYAIFSLSDSHQVHICSFADRKVTSLRYSVPEGILLSPFSSTTSPFHFHNGELFVTRSYDGHIFKIDGKKVKPHLFWDFGQYRIREKDIPVKASSAYYLNLFRKSSYRFATQFSFTQESDHYIMSQFSFRGVGHFLFYDKEKKEPHVIQRTKDGKRLVVGYCRGNVMYRPVRPDYLNTFYTGYSDDNPSYQNHVIIKYSLR